ncbi:MAG: hypothetical protein E7659_07680 [Ruminococcaceae bacterium]|nr:hypothetical protein [Oscillospiraceae bacterium]
MKFVKLFFINLAFFIGGFLLLRLLAVTLFATIFNAIFGNPKTGMYATDVFIRICLTVINGLAICIPHGRSEEARRAFLKELGAEKYDRKAALKALVKTKDFRSECIIYAIIYVTLALIATRPKWIFVVATLFFPLINLWHHTAVHKAWAGERIRLAEQQSE